MTTVERILDLIEKKGTTKNKVLMDLGLSKNSFVSWQSRGTSPQGDTLKKFANYFNVSTDYLLGNNTSTVKDPATDDQIKFALFGTTEIDDEVYEDVKRLAKMHQQLRIVRKVTPTPVLDEEEPEEEYIYLDFPTLPASAGTGIYLHSDDTEPLKVPSTAETRKANYALRVAGDSMQPRFYDGDVVLVRTQPSVEPGEIGIFIYNGEGYIKQFGGNRLISINPDYEDIYITDSDSFYCKGRVIGVLSIKRDN